MIFTKEERTNVDSVEGSFVEYKNRHPEEDDFLVEKFVVPTSYKYEMKPLKPMLTDEERQTAIDLAPWGYSFDLSNELSTDGIDSQSFDMSIVAGGRNDLLLRLSMLSYIFDHFDISGRWIDIATNCGIIPILLAKGRVLSATASDFAQINADKGNFLKKLSGDEKCRFETRDAFEHLRNTPENSIDFVSALGIFYHLSNPIEMLELMYKTTRKYVLVDTIIHNFAFSGWIQTISRHIKHPQLAHANDTRKILELHPTYRGMIDALYQVGFQSVVEVLPNDELLAAFPDTIYHSRNRRMLLASKV